MGSLASLRTEEVLSHVLGSDTAGHAEVRAQLAAAHDAAWRAAPQRQLELCRLRMAMLLGCTAELDLRTPGTDVGDDVSAALPSWPTDPRFDATDRACLGFAEHWVMDVASLDDRTAAAVRECIGDEGLQNFASALLVVEQRIRLRLVWDRLLGGG